VAQSLVMDPFPPYPANDSAFIEQEVYIDPLSLNLMAELCMRWDFSRPERLSALGIQIGVSPLSTWSGCTDTAPTRNFYLFEQDQDLEAVQPGRNEQADSINGWTAYQREKPSLSFLEANNLTYSYAQEGQSICPELLAQDALQATLCAALNDLCSRWDYSRAEMLSARGVFIGVSPLQTWPGCVDTAPTRSFYLFGPDSHQLSSSAEDERGRDDANQEPAPMFPLPTLRVSDNEPSPAVKRQTPPPAAQPEGAAEDGRSSRPQTGDPWPPPAGEPEAPEAPDAAISVAITLTRRPAPRPAVTLRTYDALGVLRAGHLVPEFAALAVGREVVADPTPRSAGPGRPTPPAPRPTRTNGWGMLLGSGLVVDSLVPGGPAHLSGLVLRGDVLTQVGGVDVRGWDVRQVAALMAAGAADELQLTVRRPAPRTFEF
jgi:hypothetical protein